MKKQTILKVLSFVVLLTLVLSAVLLSGCNEEIKADVETTKTELEAAQAALKKAEEAIEALKTAAAKLDEDSATKAALTEKAADLQTAIDENAKTLKDLNDKVVALGNSGASKDALTALETKVKALEDDLAAKATTITTLTDNLAAANKKIDDDKAELATAIAEAKDAIAKLGDTYATDAELEAAINVLEANLTKAFNDAIDAVKADYATTKSLNDEIAKINDSITALDTAIKALDATYATDAQLQTAIDGLANTYATKADTEALKTAIEAISGDDIDAEGILDAITFSGSYQDVTEVLCDDNNEYSFKAFRDLCNQKKEENFSAAVFAAYREYCRISELKLTRAATMEQVEKIFDDLKAYQAENMVSDVELFIELLEELEDHGVTLEENQLDDLDAAYLLAKEANGFTTELQDRYDAVHAARTRLENAFADATTAAEKAVELKLLAKDDDGNYILGDKILYLDDVKTNIETVKALYDAIKENYFKDDDMTSAYGIGMDDLPGYTLFNEQADAYDALQDARDALDDVELTTLPNVTANPLFTDKDGINDDIAAIEAWAEENEIDSDNYPLIVNDFLAGKNANVQLTVDSVAALKAYAEAMDTINTEKVVANDLKATIAAEIENGATGVLWTHIDALEDMFDKIDAVKEAVAGVTGYIADIDGNVDAMLGLDADGWAVLADIQARIARLKSAKEAVDTLNTTIEAKIGNVELGDMKTIEGWWKALKDIFNVDFADADDPKKDLAFDAEQPKSVNYKNYLAMTETARKNLQDLTDEYGGGVEALQGVYDVVRDAINGEKVYLTDLAKILWANKKVVELTEKIKAEAFADIMLKDGVDEATGKDAYISYLDFQTKLVAKVAEVVKLAETAEGNALAINAFAENFNLNLTGDYQAILEDVLDWIETYLGVKYEGELEARIAALIADEATQALFDIAQYDETGKPVTNEAGQCAILGIINKNYPEKGVYKFVSDISGAIAAANTMNEMLEAAKAEWADVEAAYTALTTPIDIHDTTITAAYNLYKAYETNYYAGEIVNDQFEELELFVTGIGEKAGLKTLKEAFDAKVKAAKDLYDSIMAQADELNAAGIPDESDTGIQTVLDKATALQNDMATYKTLYCNKADTDQCKFIKGDLDAELIAFKAKAKAFVVSVFVKGDNKDEIVYSGISYNIANDIDKLTIKGIFCIDRIDARKSAEKICEDYELFLDIALKDGVDRADYALEVAAES